MTADDAGEFLASLHDTSLYSIGAFFADRNPDLVEDVIEQATGAVQNATKPITDAVNNAGQTVPNTPGVPVPPLP